MQSKKRVDIWKMSSARIMLIDITCWEEAARAHGEFFGEIRPACNFVEVSRFIDTGWLVEMEADCVVV